MGWLLLPRGAIDSVVMMVLLVHRVMLVLLRCPNPVDGWAASDGGGSLLLCWCLCVLLLPLLECFDGVLWWCLLLVGNCSSR